MFRPKIIGNSHTYNVIHYYDELMEQFVKHYVIHLYYVLHIQSYVKAPLVFVKHLMEK